MMLWSFDAPNELWLSDAAIGDAGASCLGFYGGAFNPSGDQLVAHGFTGALHLWKQQRDASSSSSRGLWVPQHALGGHYGSVQDLCWGADGGCLQSVAADQTARLFSGIHGHWFELARTQVRTGGLGVGGSKVWMQGLLMDQALVSTIILKLVVGCKVRLAARYVYCGAASCSALWSLAAYGCNRDPSQHQPNTSWWNGSLFVLDCNKRFDF